MTDAANENAAANETVQENQTTAADSVKDSGVDWKAKYEELLAAQREQKAAEDAADLEAKCKELEERYAASEKDNAEKDRKIARMEVRAGNPNVFTDEVMSKCRATDPEGIRQWAEDIMAIVGQYGNESGEGSDKKQGAGKPPNNLAAFGGVKNTGGQSKGASAKELYDTAYAAAAKKNK